MRSICSTSLRESRARLPASIWPAEDACSAKQRACHVQPDRPPDLAWCGEKPERIACIRPSAAVSRLGVSRQVIACGMRKVPNAVACEFEILTKLGTGQVPARTLFAA